MKGAKSILIDLAAGPSPIIKSNSKSSIAGYKTSSTLGFKRCISSINKTSRGSKFVSNAARSLALLITGPDVDRKLTPNSLETICASVVLPNPGGPDNNM